MSGGRRTQIDIIYDMLRAIQDKGGRIKPTHLLYKSNLSHKRMTFYLDDLKLRKLVSEEQKDDHSFITITDMGNEFLANYRRIKDLTDAFGL